jgi:hypothetical protein
MGVISVILVLREVYILRISENKVLRRIFGSNKRDVTRGWRKLKRVAS